MGALSIEHRRLKIFSILDKHLASTRKTFTERFGCASLFLFKDPVEVGNIIEAAVVGNLGDGMRGVDQHPGSMS